MVTARVPEQHRRRAIQACNACKRRKERCDGFQPCARCSLRRVSDDCSYHRPERHALLSIQQQRLPALLSIEQQLLHTTTKDDFYFGDTASLSILQRVRSLVATSIGPCPLVNEPLQDYLADFRNTSAVWGDDFQTLVRPSQEEAESLLDWAMRATGRLLGVHRDTNIAQEVRGWLSKDNIDREPFDGMLWIILAVGAQSCPEDRDKTAETYFRRGSDILTNSKMDHANTTSIQAYIWITFYLLHASRRHAAISALTTAVRGAYALGLHVFGYKSPLQEDDLFRERLWRTLRTLDLFISSSLGRPPSTYEIRNVESRDVDTFINDLAYIHEIMLKEIHLKRGQSAQQFTYDMMNQHHSWTLRLHTCTAINDTSPVQKLSVSDGDQPNGPIKNVKQAYYWSIMLLTWPYLFRKAAECSVHGRDNKDFGSNNSPPVLSSFRFVALTACIDSAVRTIDMLAELLSMPKLPKRLPYAINSIFVAALTLGTAVFANLGHHFPLHESLQAAQKLLRQFQGYDPLAKRYLRTIEYLQAAGELYVERRCRSRVET
ncbi:hypothetical protein M3J09_006890 [Ascochyta lentis]